jgi:hypothetical protein
MAANAERGELSLVVDGKRYVLTITLTAMMELEDISGGRTFVEAWEGTQVKRSIRDVMLLLWAALRDKHPELASDEPGVLKKISRFVERAGGLEAINEQLTALIRLHAQPPELAAREAAGGDARPRAAAAEADAFPGDGSASTGSAAA